jgi:hypothetical protein
VVLMLYAALARPLPSKTAAAKQEVGEIMTMA